MKFQALVYILLITLLASVVFVSGMDELRTATSAHSSQHDHGKGGRVIQIKLGQNLNDIASLFGYLLMFIESIAFLCISNSPMNGLLLIVLSTFLSFGRDAHYKIKSHNEIEAGAGIFVNELLKFAHIFSTMSLSGHLMRSLFTNVENLNAQESSSQGFLYFWFPAIASYLLMWSFDVIFKNAAPVLTITSLAYVAFKSETCPSTSTWSQCLFKLKE